MESNGSAALQGVAYSWLCTVLVLLYVRVSRPPSFAIASLVEYDYSSWIVHCTVRNSSLISLSLSTVLPICQTTPVMQHKTTMMHHADAHLCCCCIVVTAAANEGSTHNVVHSCSNMFIAICILL